LEILNLTRNLQVQLISNFSYINTRVNNLSGIIQFNMNRVMNALREVNVTGYNELMYALLDILQSLKLPHEWQLPNINYTIDDTLPPISTISATSAITGGISVRWVSSDNWGVAYATICYRLDNASWKVWKPATVAAGTDVFDIDDVTLINGTVVWFRCLGTDIAGNIESETDRNVCSITYSEASTITQPIGGAMQMITDSTFYSIYFWIIIGLLVIILVSIYIYRDSVTKKKLKMEMKSRPRNPIFYEEEL